MMVGGVTTRYVYDAAGQVLLEEVGNSISSVYTWGVDGLVRKDGEYPLVDGLGSERVVTNGSQGVTASVTYDAFGNVVARSGSSSDPYQFAGSSGYRNDGDAGLTYVGAQYYDAQVGRFITRDTYLDQEPYLYCEHEPVNRLDPSGHDGTGLPQGSGNLAVGALLAIVDNVAQEISQNTSNPTTKGVCKIIGDIVQMGSGASLLAGGVATIEVPVIGIGGVIAGVWQIGQGMWNFANDLDRLTRPKH